MQVLKILDATGHSTLEITDETRAQAKATFDKFLADGGAAYRMDAPGKGTQIRDFKDVGEETILRPQLVGG